MVKFGNHLNAFIKLLENVGWPNGAIDYAKLRSFATDGAPATEEAFIAAWQTELSGTEGFYKRTLGIIHQRLYRHLHAGGAALSARLWEILEDNPAVLKSDLERLRRINAALRLLISVGEMNSEGLRKAAKKFDKVRKTNLCLRLLPELVTSPQFQDDRSKRLLSALTRAATSESEFGRVRRENSECINRSDVQFLGLKRLMSLVPDHVLRRLVAHRGFHCVGDSLRRPIENTLPAYEQAWASGTRLCECDVNLTQDGFLVLNHDEDMARLALDPIPTQMPLSDMPLCDIIASPLKSGVRPPLLKEVLDMASVFGAHAQLVIELKTSSVAVGKALAEFFAEHTRLLPHVAVVMSFDLYTMHEFAREFVRALGLERLPNAGEGRPFMLLLTVDEPVEAGCEVSLKLQGDDVLDRVKSWLVRADSELDGVYIEWTPRLLAEDSEPLSRLAQRFAVGVWQYAGQPDTLEQATKFADIGVHFVNTDLPTDFVDKDNFSPTRFMSRSMPAQVTMSAVSLSSFADESERRGYRVSVGSESFQGLEEQEGYMAGVEQMCH